MIALIALAGNTPPIIHLPINELAAQSQYDRVVHGKDRIGSDARPIASPVSRLKVRADVEPMPVAHSVLQFDVRFSCGMHGDGSGLARLKGAQRISVASCEDNDGVERKSAHVLN